MQRVLIIGATSAIAEAVARIFAERGDRLYLAARDTDKLATMQRDLKARGALSIDVAHFEALEDSSHYPMIQDAKAKLGGDIDIALLAHGALCDSTQVESAITAIKINALSVVSIAIHLANEFDVVCKFPDSCVATALPVLIDQSVNCAPVLVAPCSRKTFTPREFVKNSPSQKTIAVISSVAGDRGRQSNYIYGASKGFVSIFLQGLRNRLYAKGIHVLTIKPGFVDTPMIAHLPRNFLWATPESVGFDIVRAIDKKTDILYTPRFWFFIMLIVKLIPEKIFKRMKI